MKPVDLSRFDVDLAKFVAGRWTGSVPAYGAPGGDEGEGISVMGTLGELAAARALNLNWDPQPGAQKARDVGGLIEVRATDYLDGALILHGPDKDPDDAPFVLVTFERLDRWANPGLIYRARFPGWIWGDEGRRLVPMTNRAKTKRPAYFVDQVHLRPMSELARIFDRGDDLAAFRDACVELAQARILSVQVDGEAMDPGRVELIAPGDWIDGLERGAAHG